MSAGTKRERPIRFPATVAVPLPRDAPERMAAVAESRGLRRSEWMRQVLMAALMGAEAGADEAPIQAPRPTITIPKEG